MKHLLAVALVALLAVGTAPSTAGAHSFGVAGPPHTHLTNPGCGITNCYRWILVDGRIMQGPAYHLNGQAPWVGVLCSFKQSLGGQIVWKLNTTLRYRWGLTGLGHPYCGSPTYGPLRTPWPLRP